MTEDDQYRTTKCRSERRRVKSGRTAQRSNRRAAQCPALSPNLRAGLTTLCKWWLWMRGAAVSLPPRKSLPSQVRNLPISDRLFISSPPQSPSPTLLWPPHPLRHEMLNSFKQGSEGATGNEWSKLCLASALVSVIGDNSFRWSPDTCTFSTLVLQSSASDIAPWYFPSIYKDGFQFALAWFW